MTLTSENPDLDRIVTDRFVEDAAPGGGGSEPPPDIGVAGIKVVSPKTNLAVTKTATPTRIRTGEAVRYRVTVTNTRKTVTARSVTIAEAAPPSRLRVHVTTTKGSCTSTRPLMCSLGDLKPGQRVTLTATVRTRASPADPSWTVPAANPHNQDGVRYPGPRSRFFTKSGLRSRSCRKAAVGLQGGLAPWRADDVVLKQHTGVAARAP